MRQCQRIVLHNAALGVLSNQVISDVSLSPGAAIHLPSWLGWGQMAQASGVSANLPVGNSKPHAVGRWSRSVALCAMCPLLDMDIDMASFFILRLSNLTQKSSHMLYMCQPPTASLYLNINTKHNVVIIPPLVGSIMGQYKEDAFMGCLVYR